MVLGIANKRDQRKRPLRHRRQGRKHSVCAAEGAALIAVDARGNPRGRSPRRHMDVGTRASVSEEVRQGVILDTGNTDTAAMRATVE
jgi:hypothetical protein